MPDRYPPILRDYPHLLHGGDYNPDQWQDYPEVIDEDFRLMELAGCNCFSVGIFAWTSYEPEEGTFQFDWLDRIMDRMAEKGNKVCLATPSGAKPVWMAVKYPETRRIDVNGNLEKLGGRHNHAWTSAVYREKVRIINEKLAERYKDHPALGLWHISNEYNGADYSENALHAFREWLKAKYETLENLNAAYWSAFWSHTVTDWKQIDPRDPSVDGMILDWKRFNTDQLVDFFLWEVAAVRKHTPDVPVTTNMMGLFPHVDYWKLAPHCDVMADDMYPLHHDEMDFRKTGAFSAFVHDLHRSMRGGQPFLLMESTPSNTNWQPVPKLKRPHQHQLESLAAVGHGADGVMYFQWRKGRGGFEKFHGAVVDHVGNEKPRVFQEVASLGRNLKALAPVAGTTLQPEVAVIHDWEVRWALDTSCGPRRPAIDADNPFASPDKEYVKTGIEHYRGFWEHSLPVDIIESTSPFDPYKVVVAPMLYLLREGVAEKLREFVENGGVLIGTYLTGIVDPTNRCFLGGWPGNGLRELFGLWAEEIESLYEEDRVEAKLSVALPGLADTYPLRHYCDLVHPEGAEVLATYDERWFAGRPALTVNRFGAGHAYYLAGRPAEVDFHRAFAGYLKQEFSLRSAWPDELPTGVVVQKRQGPEETFFFLLNYRNETATVTVEESLHDVLEDAPVSGSLTLPPFGSAVLRRRD